MEPINSAAEFFSRWNFVNAQFFLVALLGTGYLIGVTRLNLRSDGAALSRSRVFYGVAGFAILVFATAGPVEVFSGDWPED